MNSRIMVFIFLLHVSLVFGQNVFINNGLDTIDVERKVVLRLWTDYLHSKPDSIYDNPYWDFNDKNHYKSYDLIKSEGYINPSLYYFKFDNRILSLTKTDNGFIIKIMFVTKRSNVFAIINVLAVKKEGKYYLSNFQHVYTSNWLTKQVGLITYHYFPEYKFDTTRAKEANEFLSNLGNKFGFKFDTVEYFICRDCDDIYRVKGFDFIFTMGNASECGFYDKFNNIVYATSLVGENHQHELVHEINNYFPKAHYLLLAGISAYWGGENANNHKPLIYHIKRINDYLKLHPEVDLNKPADFYFLDEITNPQYVIGALICDKALREGGIDKLKKIFNCGLSDDELMLIFEKELGLKKDSLNQYFRNRIKEIAEKDKFEIK